MKHEKNKKPHGLACVSPERRRQIAAMGGKAAHARGTAHKWTREEAAVAGRKGGTISRRGRKRYTAAELTQRGEL